MEERLIELVSNNAFLYDKSEPCYSKLDLKQSKWEEIADELGLSVHAVKKRWKTLRDRYNRERKTTPPGSAGASKKKWFNLLTFLDDVYSVNKITGDDYPMDETADDYDFGDSLPPRWNSEPKSIADDDRKQLPDGFPKVFGDDNESLSQTGADPLAAEINELLMKAELDPDIDEPRNNIHNRTSKRVRFRKIPCPRRSSTVPRSLLAHEISRKRLRRIENLIAYESRLHLMKIDIERKKLLVENEKLLVERKKLLAESKRIELLELQIEQAREAHEQHIKLKSYEGI